MTFFYVWIMVMGEPPRGYGLAWYGGGILLALYVAATSTIGIYFLRRYIRRLLSLNEISARLSLSEEEVKSFVALRGIHPPYEIAGRELYDPRDFEDSGRLLRAAGAVTDDRTLIRPASSGIQPDEVFVRPAESNE